MSDQTKYHVHAWVVDRFAGFVIKTCDCSAMVIEDDE